ncbi:MAG: hypothetical protein AAFZ92_03080, partial [Pseudomonadota bacterium]
MNKALQIISIQHELVLSLNTSSEIEQIIKGFLRTCNVRLNLISSHLFLYIGDDQQPCNKHSCVNGGNIEHFVSVPKQQNGKPYRYSSGLLNCVSSLEKEQQSSKKMHAENLYLFRVKGLGVLALEYRSQPDNILQKILDPILEKLSLSCTAAINNKALKN